MAEITLQSISHRYAPGAPPALHNLDLRWRDGGAYALLGASGSGKTTLLNIISGLIRPSSGRVIYGGKDVTALDPRARNIAQVFQFPVIYDTMTVFENLAFPLRNRGLRGREVTDRVHHIAEALELSESLGDRATSLSATAKQMISLGRGLVRNDVAAILFDEPLTTVDPHRKWVLRRKLREIHRQFNHTLIYVTHDQTEALTFADEVVVIHEGAVLQQGTPEQLFLEPAHTFVGYFIGSPGMNVLPCQSGGDDRVVIAGHAVPLPAELAQRAAAGTGKLELGIRPEHVTLTRAGESEDGSPGGLPVEISFVEDHGRYCIAMAAIVEETPADARDGAVDAANAAPAGPRISLKLKLPPASPPAPGERCTVRFAPAHIRLYADGKSLQ